MALFYRQADAGVIAGLSPTVAEALVGGTPTTDAAVTFAYYLAGGTHPHERFGAAAMLSC